MERKYSVLFNENNCNWDDRLVYNKSWLKMVLYGMCADKVTSEGRIALNYILGCLGFDSCPQGATYGYFTVDQLRQNIVIETIITGHLGHSAYRITFNNLQVVRDFSEIMYV